MKAKCSGVIAISAHSFLSTAIGKIRENVDWSIISGVQTIVRESDYVLHLWDLSCQPLFHFNSAVLSMEKYMLS